MVRGMERLPASVEGSASSGAIAESLHFLNRTPVFLPAGLLFYWATNTLFSIVQRCNIKRRIEAEAKRERAVGQ